VSSFFFEGKLKRDAGTGTGGLEVKQAVGDGRNITACAVSEI
jgi:hypothetical protein